MANTNCLEGMKCPECGSEGPFEIAASARFEVSDEGTGDYQDVEWDRHSVCVCKECGYSGQVFNFEEVSEMSNVLAEGFSMQCPECGSLGPFDIRGRAWFRVKEDGVVDTAETDGYTWDANSMCNCVNCADKGICSDRLVADFKEEWKNAQSRNQSA